MGFFMLSGCRRTRTLPISPQRSRGLNGSSVRKTPQSDFVGPSNLPVSGISFDDRLYVLRIASNNSVRVSYRIDNGQWIGWLPGPLDLQTNKAVATAIFRHRLYVIAIDSTTGRFRVTSTPDVDAWAALVDIPIQPALESVLAVTAAVLGDNLHILGLFGTSDPPVEQPHSIFHNSTADGTNWTGWRGIGPSQCRAVPTRPSILPQACSGTGFI